MNRTPMGDLANNLKDPEFAAGFAGVRIESNKELLRCGVISKLTMSSLESKTVYSDWGIIKEQ